MKLEDLHVTRKEVLSVETKTKLDSLADKKVKHWRLAVPFVFIAAAFYAQGRAYHEGFLNAFGIDNSLLPTTTTDIYWDAMNGWAYSIGKGVPALIAAYPHYLGKILLPLGALALITGVITWAETRGWIERARKRFSASSPKNGRPSFVAYGINMGIWVVSFPAVLIVAMYVIALVLILLVLSFDRVGSNVARDYCQRAAASFSLVHYASDQTGESLAKDLSTGRLLTCSSDECVLVRDGRGFTIAKSAFRKTDGASGTAFLAAKDAKVLSDHLAVVRPEDQLCFIPGVSPNAAVPKN